MAKDLGITILLDFYGDMLTEKQRDFLGYYYNDDLSLSEIAENEGITRQGVRDSIKRAEAQLFDMEERLGLARRFHEMRRGLDEIIEYDQRVQYAIWPIPGNQRYDCKDQSNCTIAVRSVKGVMIWLLKAFPISWRLRLKSCAAKGN